MKNIQFLILALTVIFGCQIEDALIENQENLGVKQTSNQVYNKVKTDVMIYPSGDMSGVTDSNNIESALNSSSPGKNILLTEGKFYVNRTIVANGFNGTLRGISMAKTEIIGVGSPSIPFLNGYINCPEIINGGTLFLFSSPEVSLCVSNLSASLCDGFVTEINDWGNNNLFSFIAVQLDGQSDTSFDHLRLTGGYAINDNPLFQLQPLFGLAVYGNGSSFPYFSNGDNHSITNSEISNIAIQATVHELFKNASIKVAGNSFSEVKQLITRWVDGCNILYDKNNIEAESLGTIVVTQEGVPIPGSSNSVVIKRNKVNTTGYTPIEIGVANGSANFDLLIEENILKNTGSDPLGWFDTLSGILIQENNITYIRNNIIRGTSLFGIIQASNNGWIIDNNMQGLTPVNSDYLVLGNYNTITDDGNSTFTDYGIGNVFNIGDDKGKTNKKTGDRNWKSLTRSSSDLTDLLQK